MKRETSPRRLFNWIAVALALAFIVTGSALAANDRQPPTADRLSFALQLSNPAEGTHPPGTQSGATLQPSNLPTPTDGAKLYQFWCSTCHGDRGQGLTPEWRATWPKDKQNCWQAKCHSSSHPPEGFSIPKNVPALIGPDALRKFNTVQDLYVYIRAAMPYWSPNLLKDDEYRAITVFLVKANYQAKGYPAPTTLPEEWSTFLLHPTQAAESTSKTVDSSPQPASDSLALRAFGVLTPSLCAPLASLLLALPLLSGGLIIFFLLRRFWLPPR